MTVGVWIATGDDAQDAGAAGSQPSHSRTRDEGAAAADHADNPMMRLLRARPWTTAANLSDEERALIQSLVDELEGRLWHASGQMALLEDLVGWLKEHYPDSWRAELERVLRAAFPDMADDLLRMWDGRDRHEEWMREHRAELAKLPPDERRRRVWEAREEHFGEATDELFAAAHQNEAISDALERIDAEPNASVEERFDEYMGAIEDQYQDQTDDMLQQRRQEVMDRFLALSSVQDELAQLDAEARYAKLRALRQAEGMDEAALDRWGDLDRRRDDRWTAGQRYMQEREELLSSYDGDALQQRLQQLRQQYFGEQADTVRHEEESGFFRFERNRTYGRN